MAILYKSIAHDIEALVEKNIERGIPKLPTEKELCEKFHVSRQTIRQSLSLLEQRHIIEKRQGSGIYITGILDNPEKNKIYLMISSEQDYIYPDIIEDIHQTLRKSGFTDQVFVTANQVCRETEYLKAFLENPPRGLIVEGCCSARPNPNGYLYEKLQEKGTFVIFLFNRYMNFDSSFYIKDDNAYGSSLLVRHLYEEGHTKIGGIFKSDDLQGVERYLGFAQTMQKFGLDIPDDRIGWYDTRQMDALRSRQDTSFLRDILHDALKDCTAVICYNDEIAYWLIKELNRAGYHLPEDIAVTAFDNTYTRCRICNKNGERASCYFQGNSLSPECQAKYLSIFLSILFFGTIFPRAQSLRLFKDKAEIPGVFISHLCRYASG